MVKEAYFLPTQILICGVVQKSKYGVPLCVMKEDKTDKDAKRAQGMMKLALLKNDGKSRDSIVASYYDKIPLFMLFYSIKEITWVECKKKV